MTAEVKLLQWVQTSVRWMLIYLNNKDFKTQRLELFMPCSLVRRLPLCLFMQEWLLCVILIFQARSGPFHFPAKTVWKKSQRAAFWICLWLFDLTFIFWIRWTWCAYSVTHLSHGFLLFWVLSSHREFVHLPLRGENYAVPAQLTRDTNWGLNFNEQVIT